MANKGCIDGSCKDSSIFFNGYTNNAIMGEKKMSQGSTLPPLPEPIILPSSTSTTINSTGTQWRDSVATYPNGLLQPGCYYMRLMPTSLHTPSKFQYEGTLRIQRSGNTILASGDLYNTDICSSTTYCPSLSVQEERKNNIPVFPRQQYAHYLRVLRIQESGEQGSAVTLDIEPFRFDHPTSTWSNGEPLSIDLKFSTASDGIQYWRGDIMTGSKIVLGHMIVVWVSSFLRQAVIEIDRVASSECPITNERGEGWTDIFRKIGWDLAVEISDEAVEEPEDFSWSNAELHMKMLKYRQSVDLDKQWRYHLLAVQKLDDEAFGVMYDNNINGIDSIPREGAAIASHVIFSNDDYWGKCKNGRFGTFKDPYFRTAIHEIGHALMLYHSDNAYENYFMQTTVQIAHNAIPPLPFPDNIDWSFSPRDTRLLCHLPDMAIRPGGITFGTPLERLPMNVRDEVVEPKGLRLNVSALNDVIPLGVPARINFSLINTSDQNKQVPGSLSMKTGNISGRVIDSMGISHDFATIIRYTGEIMPQTLFPGDRIDHSVTLLWGTNGPLFPNSGYYRIVIEINWYQEGVRIRTAGVTSLMVTPPKDDEQARAALKIFSTPDAFMALTIGGDHMDAAYDIIRNAIKHPVLAPHYQLIEGKRLGQRFFSRKSDLKRTLELVDENTVMSSAEVRRLIKILINFTKQTDVKVVKKIGEMLLSKAKKMEMEKKHVEELTHFIEVGLGLHHDEEKSLDKDSI